jgi:ATP-binding cassette subfamily C protein
MELMDAVTGPRRRLLAGLREIVHAIVAESPARASLTVVVLVALTFIEGAGLLLLAPLLENLMLVEENPLPRIEGWLQTLLSWAGLEISLGSLLLLYVAIAVVRAGLLQWRTQLVTSMRENVIYAYRQRLYRAVVAAEWRFLVTRTPSELVYALTHETNRIGPVVTQLVDLAAALMVSLIYFGVAVRLSPALAAVVLTAAGLLAIYVQRSLEEARDTGADGAAAKKRLHRAMAEQISGLKTARTFGVTAHHAQQIDTLSQSARDIWLSVTLAKSRFQQTLELASTILLAAIVFGSVVVLDVSPALLLVLLYIFARLVPRLINIYRLVQALVTALPVVDSLVALERDCAAAAEPVVAGVREIALRRAITFDDVSFSYLSRGEAMAVAGVRMRIAAGKTTAIVGPSGSGKSSIADLLVGLLTPTAGRILVDDEPLAPETLASWRSQIAYVPQETFLFDDTVRANLQWARPDATEPEIWDALRLAAADAFVADLPNGLDTIIGERGVLLSGGERQRLSIARALLRRPSILLLDEATSSLDVEHERKIQRAIELLRHRVTLVVITHRLTTIRHADTIHVIDRGAVAQSGTWEELQMQPDGRFRAFLRELASAPARESA